MSKGLVEKLDQFNKQLQEVPHYDHIRTAILAGLNAIPYIGGSLGVLFDSYIPSKKQTRIIKYIDDLKTDIKKLNIKINSQIIQTDEFAYIFEKTFKGVADNYQKEKIESYKAIFLNTLTEEIKINDEQKEVFLNILETLTVRHIRILKVLNSNQHGDLYELMQRDFPIYTRLDINYIMVDLRSKGLIPLSPSITSSNLRDDFNQLTEIGKTFVSFITSPKI